jgi:hypothetical protein
MIGAGEASIEEAKKLDGPPQGMLPSFESPRREWPFSKSNRHSLSRIRLPLVGLSRHSGVAVREAASGCFSAIRTSATANVGFHCEQMRTLDPIATLGLRSRSCSSRRPARRSPLDPSVRAIRSWRRTRGRHCSNCLTRSTRPRTFNIERRRFLCVDSISPSRTISLRGLIQSTNVCDAMICEACLCA